MKNPWMQEQALYLSFSGKSVGWRVPLYFVVLLCTRFITGRQYAAGFILPG